MLKLGRYWPWQTLSRYLKVSPTETHQAHLRACEARELRARKTHTPRFTDFFTDFEKKNDCLQSNRNAKLTVGVYDKRFNWYYNMNSPLLSVHDLAKIKSMPKMKVRFLEEREKKQGKTKYPQVRGSERNKKLPNIFDY